MRFRFPSLEFSGDVHVDAYGCALATYGWTLKASRFTLRRE